MTVRLSGAELQKLEDYCLKLGKAKSEVIREFIHQLKVE